MLRQLRAYLHGHGARRSAIELKANTHLVDVSEGRDYHLDARGRVVFTAAYLLARGECCGREDCENCPYRNRS